MIEIRSREKDGLIEIEVKKKGIGKVGSNGK